MVLKWVAPDKGHKVWVPSKHFMLSTILKLVAESENIDMYFKLWIVPNERFQLDLYF